MDERYGESCTDLLNEEGIKKVYAGFMDPTQDEDHRQFNIMETANESVRKLCKEFADTFLELNEAWSEKYKRSINCNNPKGFSQRAHCQGRKKNEDLNEFAPDDSGDSGQEDLFFKYAKLWYNGNLKIQQRIEQILADTGWEIGELESEEGGAFIVQSGDENGDTYMGWSADELRGLAENFADGKKPGRKGLAKRSGVNCKQSVSKLRSIAKNSSGERQRMAHWCANMKSGRNK